MKVFNSNVVKKTEVVKHLITPSTTFSQFGKLVIPKGGYFTAVLESISPISPDEKHSIDFESFQWHWKIIAGKYKGLHVYGLTPRAFFRNGTKNERRLTQFVEKLLGRPLNSKTFRTFNYHGSVSLDSRLTKFYGIKAKIRIHVYRTLDGQPYSYHISSIKKVIK